MTERLTPATARALMPGGKLRDHEIKGLELVAGAERKSWRLYYRTKAGTERRPTLGHFPDIGLEAARAAARHILTEVAKGLDPAADWQAKRRAPTVWELWEHYHSTWLVKKRRASTVAEYKRQMESVLRPAKLARMAVADVTLADVEAWLEEVRSRKFVAARAAETMAGKKRRLGTPKGGGERADKAGNRALAVLSGMFKHAELRANMRPRGSNPCSCADRAPPGRRERYATAAELAAIGAYLRSVAPAEPYRVALLVALLFTGARTSELAQLLHTDVTEDYGTARVREHKSMRVAGVKELHLPEPVRELLRKLPPHTSGRLFGDLPSDPLRSLWARVQAAAGCPDLQIRDLRRTFASIAYNGRADERTIQALLGHQDPETTRIYTVLFSESKQRTAEDTADRAAKMLGM